MSSVDWGSILGGGSFLGLLTLVMRDAIRAYANRGKVSADVGAADAAREVTLSKATLDALNDLREQYEAQMRSVREDAKAQIASARADAANSVAAAMHEVSSARGEVSQIRAEATAIRNVVERIEQLLLRARSMVWAAGPEDPRITRAREVLGDGSVPISVLINGSR